MNRTVRTVLLASIVLAAILIGGIYALFHGYFDTGQFQIVQAQSFSSQLVIVAKRSDHQALNGDQYFVIIADHMLSARELRRDYYGGGVIFEVGNSCITAGWKSSKELEITCGNGAIKTYQIAIQKNQFRGIAVSYNNIPTGQANSSL